MSRERIGYINVSEYSLSRLKGFAVKKFAAAALAAAMSLSVVAPAADAASNTMERNGTVCRISLDGDLKGKSGLWDRSKVIRSQELGKLTEDNVGAVRASADLGQAFGSSDADAIAAANNAEAIQACKEGENYVSEEMDGWKQAGIIIGVILIALSGLASVAGPALQQFL